MNPLLLLLLSSILSFFACTSEIQSIPSESPTVLASGTWTDLNRDYQLLAIPFADNKIVYAQWFPPMGANGPRPAILSTAPYAGIDWTTDPIDERWATQNSESGCYPDEDAPLYEPGVSADTCYFGTLSPLETAAQVAGPLLNDVGVLLVFGRFYAGIPLNTAVEGVVAATAFLAGRPDQVDCTRIASTGTSLGGFEAMHGAALAPSSCKPIAVAGLAPLLDLSTQVHYIEQTIPERLGALPEKNASYQTTFDPYLRRIKIFAGDGPTANYAPYTLNDLAPTLPPDTLVMHDTWDTLVPIESSQRLVDQGAAEGFWFTHADPIDYTTFDIDHKQPDVGLDYATLHLFSDLYTLTRVTPPDEPLLIPYGVDSLAGFLAEHKEAGDRGEDLSWLVPRLLELSEARVLLIDFDRADSVISGADALGPLLNTYWAAHLAPDQFATQVPQFLANTGL